MTQDELTPKTKTKIGDRVGAICCEHGRSVCFFGYGVYKGNQLPPSPAPPVPNPKIELDNGHVVWGFQCWWAPEDQIKKRLQGKWVKHIQSEAPLAPNPAKPTDP